MAHQLVNHACPRCGHWCGHWCGALRTVLCACGKTITADRDDPSLGVMSHQMTDHHAAWSRMVYADGPQKSVDNICR